MAEGKGLQLEYETPGRKERGLMLPVSAVVLSVVEILWFYPVAFAGFLLEPYSWEVFAYEHMAARIPGFVIMALPSLLGCAAGITVIVQRRHWMARRVEAVAFASIGIALSMPGIAWAMWVLVISPDNPYSGYSL